MMYIDYKATAAGEVKLENAVPATVEEIAAFNEKCYEHSGKWQNYIPSFEVINGNIIFYEDGPWEC